MIFKKWQRNAIFGGKQQQFTGSVLYWTVGTDDNTIAQTSAAMLNQVSKWKKFSHLKIFFK